MMDSPTKYRTIFVIHLYYTSESFEVNEKSKQFEFGFFEAFSVFFLQNSSVGENFRLLFMILTSLAIDTKVGNRCKNALNFSSASFCVDARYKLRIIED